jgi:diacylglycerol kinase (ATP)
MAFGDGVTHREDATIQHGGAGLDASNLDIPVTLELRRHPPVGRSMTAVLGEDWRAGALSMRTTRALLTVRARRPRRFRSIQIVTTPGSGNGGALTAAGLLDEELRARGHEVRVDVFPRLQGLLRWAATDASRFSLLISVGGDGTQSAVAMAAARRSVPFLPVPAGFGNLFARAFRQPSRVEEVLDLFEHGELVHVDVGLQNGEPFLCHASFGLLSEVQARVESAPYPRVRWRRWVEYYRAAVRHLRETPLAALQVAVDGRVVTRDAAVVTVANVKTYGGWLQLTPAASPTDGLFDVFVMHGATKRQILAGLLRRHLRIPGSESGTHVYRGRRASVVAPGAPRNDLELMPGVLPVLVSPEARRALGRVLVPEDGPSPVWQRRPA